MNLLCPIGQVIYEVSFWEVIQNYIYTWIAPITVYFLFRSHVFGSKAKQLSVFWRMFWINAGALAMIAALSFALDSMPEIRKWTRVVDCHKAGQSTMVEGVVKVKYVGRSEGHDGGDRIVISGVEFNIDFHHSHVGYNESIFRGGFLTEGRNVRVWYIEGGGYNTSDGRYILRIESLRNLKGNEI